NARRLPSRPALVSPLAHRSMVPGGGPASIARACEPAVVGGAASRASCDPMRSASAIALLLAACAQGGGENVRPGMDARVPVDASAADASPPADAFAPPDALEPSDATSPQDASIREDAFVPEDAG